MHFLVLSSSWCLQVPHEALQCPATSTEDCFVKKEDEAEEEEMKKIIIVFLVDFCLTYSKTLGRTARVPENDAGWQSLMLAMRKLSGVTFIKRKIMYN